jgi:WD40 repeat protein
MKTQALTTTLSTEVLTFYPEGPPPTFEVTVHNVSQTFASFQLDMAAAGVETQVAPTWYRVAPAISSKIPGGARTRFQVSILAVPPLPSGFSGTVNLTLRVSSLELRQEDRQILRLVVEGRSRLPPRLTVPSPALQSHPQGETMIPVQVQNLNRQSVDIHLRLTGIPAAWLPDGFEKPLHLPAQEEATVEFRCLLPEPSAAPSGQYPLTITAEQAQTVAVTAEASLTVRPQGHVTLTCTPAETTLPPQPGRWWNPGVATTTYHLAFANFSNADQVALATARYRRSPDNRALVEAPPPLADITPGNDAAIPIEDEATAAAPGATGETSSPPDAPIATASGEAAASDPPSEAETNRSRRRGTTLTLSPPQATVARGGETTVDLTVTRPLPLLGWPRRKQLQVAGAIANPDVPLRQGEQTLELQIFPVMPFWLQLLAGALGIAAALVLWWFFFQRGHQGAVNSLTFEGSGHELLSASDDQTLRRWVVRRGSQEGRKDLIRTDKAIRIARYRPVNNDQIWAGYENGEMQGWDLQTRRTYTLAFNRDDRVFDIVLPWGGRRLISGHGSGLVLEWDITPGQIRLTQTEPLRGFNVNFAIQALALAGIDQEQLIVAGRYNRLALLNLSTEQLQPLNYPSGGGNQFILDVAIAPEKPTLMAVADNEGRLSLWDLSACLAEDSPLEGNQPCQVIDDWTTGHQEAPVRSVAFSADGCYLVSGGEDGRVMLWPLSTQGRRRPDAQEGQRWFRGRQNVTAVAIQQTPQRLMVAYGLERGQVRVRSRGFRPSNLPPGECPATSP